MIYQPSPIGRVCRKCGQWFPRSQLRKNRNQPDGVERMCITCNRKEATQYFYAHQEETIDKRRKEYAEYGDKVRARNKKSRDKHKDKRITAVKEWQKRNPEKTRLAKSKSAHKNLGKYREAKRLAEAKRQARKLLLPDTLTAEEWNMCLRYFDNCYAVCGRPAGLFHTLAMDHWIPLTNPSCPGTTAKNIVPLCHSQTLGDMGCNNTKQDKNPLTWLILKLGKAKGTAKYREIMEYFETLS